MKEPRKVKIESLDRLLMSHFLHFLENRRNEGKTEMFYFSYLLTSTNKRWFLTGLLDPSLSANEILRGLSARIEDEPIQLV